MQFVGDTLDDILRKVLARLLKVTTRIKATRGATRELIGVSIRLRNPRARLSHTERKGRVFSAIGELLWYLARTNSLRFIEYYLPDYGVKNSEDGKTIYGAYGPRLFSMQGINQVENVLELLRNKPNSRRAVIQLFDARDIDNSFLEIPCTCSLQFLLRRGELDMLVHMRSNDAYLGFSHDVFAFTMIQEIVARSLNADLGRYYHFVGSMHLYDEKDELARQYVNEGWQPTVLVEMESMPNGDPWPSIKQLLRVESRLRRGKDVDLNASGLAPYWQDMARLLQIFRASKESDTTAIQHLRKQMISNVFDEYIEYREERTKRRRTSGQLTLSFKDQPPSRKTIPRWLNEITKSVLSVRDESVDMANEIIPWSSPVPFFGDVTTSVVATVAVNPSNREFCDTSGEPLPESKRRLETLASLSIPSWNAAKHSHFKRINHRAMCYFNINPYTTWFKHLERILEGAEVSFYGNKRHVAAHVDLVPYATDKKWTALNARQRSSLLQQCSNCLAELLKHSPIRVLLLNGSTVAKHLEELASVRFTKREIDDWSLARRNGGSVPGVAIEGSVSQIGDVDLGKQITVVGYNHNLQSSYGVSAAIKSSIKVWICEQLKGELNETERPRKG